MAQSALIAAFMAGLLGGLHCIAMCGGYVGALATRPEGTQNPPILHARTLFARSLLQNIWRIGSYSILGAAFGAAGSAFVGSEWLLVQRSIFVVANLLLLLLAFAIGTGRSPFGALEQAGLAVYRRMLPAAARLGRRPGLGGRVVLGVLWGFTPCGLVYGVLPVAMLSGSAANGALVMAAFGLGTLPNLVAAGMLAGRAMRAFHAPAWRYAGAAVVAAFALVGLFRGVFVPEALAHGPFCIVPP